MTDEVDDHLTLGCAVMVVGVVLLVLAAMLYGGAAMNKTTTGMLEPAIAALGAAVLVLGVVLRVRWVREGSPRRPPH